MIWVGLTLIACGLLSLALLANRRNEAWGLLFVVSGLVGVQIWKYLQLQDADMWLAFFLSWLFVATLVYDVNTKRSWSMDASTLLLICVSLCYMWGWIAEKPFNPKAPQLFWADVIGLAAWFVMGGPSIAIIGKQLLDTVGRWYRMGGILGSGNNYKTAQSQAGTKAKEGLTKVTSERQV